MELFLKVYFYMGLVGLVLQLLLIGTSKYPRVVEFSLGKDMVRLFISSGFLVWSIYLLYFSN